MKKATVRSLDRTNLKASCQLQGGALVDALWLGGPPPPASTVLIEEASSGAWVIVGQTGAYRTLVSEDWTTAANTAAGVYSSNHTWTEAGTAAGVAVAGFGGRSGVVAVTSGAVAGQYHTLRQTTATSYNVTAPEALWLSAEMSLSDFTQSAVIVGFSGDGVSDFSAIAGADATAEMLITNATASTSALVNLNTASAGVATTSSTGITVSTWWTIDLVVCSSWAALWVNGLGPMVNTANIPTISESINIAAGVYPYTAAARTLYIDWLQVVRFANATRPT